VELLVFPELFTLQLLTFKPSGEPALSFMDKFTEQYISMFRQLSSEFQINIVAGSLFTSRGDAVQNVAFLFEKNGEVNEQSKVHITPWERDKFEISAANDIRVFDTSAGKVAILICYDIEFPEVARIAASKGAEIICVPFNTDNRASYLRVRFCAQARCIENHVYVVMSGCTGSFSYDGLQETFYAQSAILTPSDNCFHENATAAECLPNSNSMCAQTVDLDLLRTHRDTGTVRNWHDRRSDLYQVIYPDGSI
jgi:predicted amidohydrolase